MDLDVVLLSRIQFALTVMFHYLFPPLTIGLGLLLVIFEGLRIWTGEKPWELCARFWTRIFAVNFALGVATGIVMEFEFGTNWAAYSRYVGDVFGSALAAEGIFAFFLESGFLAVLVFGWDRVSPAMHFFSTIMVCFGSIFSAVWIVVANSWQQTPAGFHIVGEGLAARAEITDFWAMVFNPSTVERLTHTILGAFILGAFFVMSVTAFYLLKNRHVALSKRMFGIALLVGAIGSIAILISGHSQAVNVAETQPEKLAAFEGLFKTPEGATELFVFGVPNVAEQRVDYGVAIPGMLSFLVHGDWTTPVSGLDVVPEDERPPVHIPFQSYHLMVALGMFQIGVTVLACILWMAGKLYRSKWLLRVFVFAVLAPMIANQAGWVAAEVGRQPWIVYKLLRTTDAVSESVSSQQVLGSIIMFMLIYALLFAVWVFVLDDKIRKGPADVLPEHARDDESWFGAAVHGAGSSDSLTATHDGK